MNIESIKVSNKFLLCELCSHQSLPLLHKNLLLFLASSIIRNAYLPISIGDFDGVFLDVEV